MFMLETALSGLLIGFTIAALPPIGPISLLCLRRTLAEGRMVGLVSGLGAATADAVFGLIAGLGLTVLAEWLNSYAGGLRLAGGVFLLYLGGKTLLAPPAHPLAAPTSRHLAAAYASTLALTLTSPVTIFAFLAVFAGLGLGTSPNSGTGGGGLLLALLLAGGVFVGSSCWWLLLSGGASLLRPLFTPARMRWMNRGTGALIAGFGWLVVVGSL